MCGDNVWALYVIYFLLKGKELGAKELETDLESRNVSFLSIRPHSSNVTGDRMDWIDWFPLPPSTNLLKTKSRSTNLSITPRSVDFFRVLESFLNCFICCKRARREGLWKEERGGGKRRGGGHNFLLLTYLLLLQSRRGKASTVRKENNLFFATLFSSFVEKSFLSLNARKYF